MILYAFLVHKLSGIYSILSDPLLSLVMFR